MLPVHNTDILTAHWFFTLAASLTNLDDSDCGLVCGSRQTHLWFASPLSPSITLERMHLYSFFSVGGCHCLGNSRSAFSLSLSQIGLMLQADKADFHCICQLAKVPKLHWSLSKSSLVAGSGALINSGSFCNLMSRQGWVKVKKAHNSGWQSWWQRSSSAVQKLRFTMGILLFLEGICWTFVSS